MFFDRKWSRVEGQSEYLYFWHGHRPKATKREGQQLRDDLCAREVSGGNTERGGDRALTPVTVTPGRRKKKNWFMPGRMMAQISPMVHARIVFTGMSGSSVLATAERTSG